MRILAFDVSLYRTGVALLEGGEDLGADAIIPTSKNEPRHAQLANICACAQSYILQYRPDIIAIETSATWQRNGHDSTKTTEALAQARAAVLIAADEAVLEFDTRVIEKGVHEVRATICGNRVASKDQVVASLQARGFIVPRIITLDRKGHVIEPGPYDYDIADAMALGLSVWFEERLRAMAV